jgi:FixJ family two-component response regulator
LESVPVISIIDDDESVRIALNSLVRSHGFVVYTFSSAEEFLQSPRMNDTSCLITDVQMPGMKGGELQSLLIARGQRTPVIFISAFPEERIRTRLLEAGAICFLSKPFDEGALMKCLDAALKGHKDEPTKR